MKKQIQSIALKAGFVAIFVIQVADAGAQQRMQQQSINPRPTPSAPSAQQKPATAVPSTPAQSTTKSATPSIVRPGTGAAQTTKVKSKEQQSLADATPTRPARFVSQHASLSFIKDIGHLYYATIATELDALDPKFTEDVVIIKAAFKRLQQTKDITEAEQLFWKLGYLLTDVASNPKERSKLDIANVSSVAEDLRSLEKK